MPLLSLFLSTYISATLAEVCLMLTPYFPFHVLFIIIKFILPGFPNITLTVMKKVLGG